MKQSFQKKYNDSINLISHLILTKPKPVIGLLAKHGIIFKGTPDRKQIVNEVVELLKSGNAKFEDDLGKLLTIHIQFKGKEMLNLESGEFSAYDDGDEDGFWGALAKGAIGIVGGLIGKKKRRRRSRGGGNTAALAASQAAQRRAAAQAAQAKRDMERRMREMQQKMQREREAAEQRRQQEAAERRRREEAAKKKQTNTLLMAGGGIALLAIVGVVMAKSGGSRQPGFVPAPAQAQPIVRY